MKRPAVRAFGESAVLVELGEEISEDLVVRCASLADRWEAAGHGSALPTYASVLLRFDPLRLSGPDAEREAARLAEASAGGSLRTSRTIEIPTIYDGPDLAETAALSGCSEPELIALHLGRDYRAYFLGFLPGFAYCGALDRRITAPRLDRPRERVAAGSVAVADGQTAVYPFDSPGGWRLIGRTEVAIFDPTRDPAALVQAGDRVRFVRT